MSLETQVKASARHATARVNCFKIQRLEKGVFEYVSKGVTREEPLIFAFEPETIAASSTVVFKWSSAEKTTSGFDFEWLCYP